MHAPLVARAVPARLTHALLLGATLAVAAPVLAQTSANVAPSPATDAGVPAATPAAAPATPDSAPAAAAPRGPTLDGARAGATIPKPAGQESAAAFAPQNKSMGQPLALMLVGGAAVVVGLLIGDTGGNLLAFGGAIVGLVGLYQFLR
jgi:hypothetical protein